MDWMNRVNLVTLVACADPECPFLNIDDGTRQTNSFDPSVGSLEDQGTLRRTPTGKVRDVLLGFGLSFGNVLKWEFFP